MIRYKKPTLTKHNTLKNITFSSHGNCDHEFELADSTVTIDGKTTNDKVNICRKCGMIYWNL